MSLLQSFNKCDVQLQEKLLQSVTVLQYSFLFGIILGGLRGGQRSALQFNAETNPLLHTVRTRRDLQVYIRKKNAYVMSGAGREGWRRGWQMIMLGSLFESLQWIVVGGRNMDWWNFKGEEIAAGLITGATMGMLQSGQRFYNLQRGLFLGGSLGGLISILKYLAEKYNKCSEN